MHKQPVDHSHLLFRACGEKANQVCSAAVLERRIVATTPGGFRVGADVFLCRPRSCTGVMAAKDAALFVDAYRPPHNAQSARFRPRSWQPHRTRDPLGPPLDPLWEPTSNLQTVHDCVRTTSGYCLPAGFRVQLYRTRHRTPGTRRASSSSFTLRRADRFGRSSWISLARFFQVLIAL
jgi:hypothetical protein